MLFCIYQSLVARGQDLPGQPQAAKRVFYHVPVDTVRCRLDHVQNMLAKRKGCFLRQGVEHVAAVLTILLGVFEVYV